jgi:hypothetical protein
MANLLRIIVRMFYGRTLQSTRFCAVEHKEVGMWAGVASPSHNFLVGRKPIIIIPSNRTVSMIPIPPVSPQEGGREIGQPLPKKFLVGRNPNP